MTTFLDIYLQFIMLPREMTERSCGVIAMNIITKGVQREQQQWWPHRYEVGREPPTFSPLYGWGHSLVRREHGGRKGDGGVTLALGCWDLSGYVNSTLGRHI